MPMTESAALIPLSKAEQMLEKASNLDEIGQIHDIAAAAQAYARAHDLGDAAVNHATRIRLLAAQKGGGLLKKMEKAEGGKPYQKSTGGILPPVSTLASLGIDKDRAKEWRLAARVKPKDFTDFLKSAGEGAKRLTLSGLQKLVGAPPLRSRPWLRIYQVWNFMELDENFGIEHPGRIPAQIMMNLNYYYTKPGDLVVDVFGGGGSTLDVCNADDIDFGSRKCMIYDIKPVREDIKQWDVVKSGLPDFPHARLLFLDPPYWNQKQGEYSKIGTDMSNLPLGRFHDELEKIVVAGRERADLVALIIGPTQKNWELTDHAAEMIRRVGVPWKRIQVPYSTQQHGGAHVNVAKEAKQWLYLARDLMIWSGTKTL